MFYSALVALDLSPAEEPVLDCLPDLMNWGVRKLTLTHVIKVGYNEFADLGHKEHYRQWLDKSATALREKGFEVDIAVRSSGVIADEILATADDLSADLIIIGSRAQSRVRGIFLGSVVREVIRTATRPVLLQWVEPDADTTRERCEAVCKNSLSHILLATDLSPQARAAEDAAINLAPAAKQLDLLTILTGDALAATPAWPTMVTAALEDIRSRLPDQSVQATILTKKENSDRSNAQMISQVAADRDCTLIIVGKHGQGWLKSKIIGSTAASLCEIARRPVLMVPTRNQE